ncbi:MAG: DUF2190 family protein [Rhizobiaceae bacterium]|nr:DUF2190 family protein [Rhizobiaceae bacterium]
MRNLVKEGDVVEVKAPVGGLLPGDVFIKDAIVGVAYGSGSEGEDVRLKTSGTFTLSKTAGQAWTQGKKTYWTGTEATTTASGNTLIGFVALDAASGAVEGQVKIGPVF